ncbi:MAG: formylglycine-generating enzyme family protein [Bacteroidales bacterium]|nr:formylglycine-generating enzyme family protein [Bacteroidales bacterium]
MNKKLLLLTIVLCCATLCFGQKEGLDKIDYNKSLTANTTNIKLVESQMKYINHSYYKTLDKNVSAGDFYISIFEITNSLYKAFLKDLKDNKLEDLYEKCKINGEGWLQISEAFESTAKTYHTDAKWNEYPVVNISQEAAETFCLWLTKLYAAYNGAKFNNAEFRLPTESEWIIAAAGGSENSLYPWDGKFLRNKKGEWNANFKIAGEENIRINPKTNNIEILDNNILYQTTLSPVKAFEPNKYGLYQMAGNAAELTSNGKVKGGSWHSFGYYMQIAAEDEPGLTELPNPFTGFRIVMKAK